MTTARMPTPLQDVLHAFSLAKPVPDADVLEEFTRRYPNHAAALTEFAIELAVDALRGRDEAGPDEAADPVSPAVARAMSAFQNRLFEVRRADASTMSAPSIPASAEPNPFATLDRAAFRRVAEALGANTVFVGKLRDRQIDPATMTEGFRRRVSVELSVPVEVLDAHFAGPPLLGAQLYKAEGKPGARPKQAFEAAVKGCGLSDAQQQQLLKL
jgi:hypothetical protein